MDNIRLFETTDEFINSSLPIPSITFNKETNSLSYNSMSKIIAKYKLTQDIIDEYIEKGEVPIFSGATDVLHSYSINGVKYKVEQPIIENITQEVKFVEHEIEGQTAVFPNVESSLKVNYLGENITLICDNNIDVSDYVLVCWYSNDELTYAEPFTINNSESFIINENELTFSPIFYEHIINFKDSDSISLSIVDSEYVSNYGMINPTKKTYIKYNKIVNLETSKNIITVPCNEESLDKEYNVVYILRNDAKHIGQYGGDLKETFINYKYWYTSRKSALYDIDLTHLDRKKTYFIADNAFLSCTKLTKFVVPNNITSLGENSFRLCENMTDFTIGNNVSEIGISAFHGSHIQNLYCNNLSSWCNIEFSSMYSNPINVETNFFVNGKNINELVIPDDVLEIKRFAFYEAKFLKTLTIGDKTQKICNDAFYGTNVENVNIGEGLMEIGNNAFHNCQYLQTIRITTNIAPKIESSTFYNVGKNGILYYPVMSDYSSWMNTNQFYLGYYGWKGMVVDSDKPYSIKLRYNITDTTKECTLIQNIDNVYKMKIDGNECELNNLYTFDTIGEHEVEFLFGHKIPKQAFYKNNLITEVEIYDNIAEIDMMAFDSCENLTSIKFSNSVKKINTSAFRYCYGLTEIVIPDSVTSMGEQVFFCCSGLKSVTIGNNVTSIARNTFYKCDNLTEVVIPDSVTSIEGNAFASCRSLTEVVIPDSVTNIGDSAFYKCSGLTSVAFGDNIKIIENNAFTNCYGLTEIAIPESVTSIGNSAFNNCDGLTEVVIPDSVTNIGKTAFINCSNLTSVTISNNVDSIKDSTFENCGNLQKVTLGNNITSIGSSAFTSCISLKEIVILDSVTSISDRAFLDCHKLESITIGSGLSIIEDYAFLNCGENLNTIIVDENNQYYDSRENCNAIIRTATNELILGCKNTIIPNTVTSIGEYAFYKCSGLTEIVIPDYVTIIGDSAFSNCSGLTSVIIGSGVNSVGGYAFKYCVKLSSITCKPITEPKLPAWHASAFELMSSNGTLYYPKGSDYSNWIAKLTECGWKTQEIEIENITE